MKIQIYSRKQIIFTSVFSGTLPASYLIYKNFINLNQKRKANLTLVFGYFTSFLTYFLAIFIADYFINATGIFRTNRPLGYVIVILIFLLIQVLMSIVLLYTCRRMLGANILDTIEDDYKKRSLLSVLSYFVVGLALTTYLFIVGPFWFMFLIMYLIPNVYIFSHLQKAINSNRKRFIVNSVFILLVVFFPLNEIADQYSTHLFQKIILLTGYYYLPLMLYCFLLYIVFDFFLLLNHVAGFIPKEKINSINFRIFALSLIIAISIGIELKGIYNFNNTHIQQYHIELPKKSGSLDHLKIALAADIHLSEITRKSFVNQFVSKMNSIDPDIIILAGDIIESNQRNDQIEYFEKEFQKLDSKYGVYAIEGNHDLYGPESKLQFFENANIELLRDSIVIIENSLYLLGRKDRHDRKRKSLEKLVSQIQLDLSTILLNHQPYNLDSTYNYNIDMQVSGHTHHGQLFPINFITKYIYELSWGYEKIQNTHFFVTCGAQGWGPPVKTASRSEIMEINVEFITYK